MELHNYLIDALEAAVKAGAAIMEVYASDFAVETKDDRSPLTLADKQSHEIIQAALNRHKLPFVSEEGRDIAYQTRSQWPMLWIVDPLDGTKEFVKRNGEFTVNIALIEDQSPVMGVVYAPVNQWLYFAAKDIGAYKITGILPGCLALVDTQRADEQVRSLLRMAMKLPLGLATQSVYTIVGSRSHQTPALKEFVEAKKKEMGEVEFIAAGSSLKICLVAEGTAHIYPRLGPTMEWDTAAGQAIAECAGAKVYGYESGRALQYNRENLLNPWFVVER